MENMEIRLYLIYFTWTRPKEKKYWCSLFFLSLQSTVILIFVQKHIIFLYSGSIKHFCVIVNGIISAAVTMTILTNVIWARARSASTEFAAQSCDSNSPTENSLFIILHVHLYFILFYIFVLVYSLFICNSVYSVFFIWELTSGFGDWPQQDICWYEITKVHL